MCDTGEDRVASQEEVETIMEEIFQKYDKAFRALADDEEAIRDLEQSIEKGKDAARRTGKPGCQDE